MSRRAVWMRAAAVSVGLLAAALSCELGLRVLDSLLPRDDHNAIHSCYHAASEARQLDFVHPRHRLLLSKPNFRTHCGWNGYRWSHASDRFGHRDPEQDHADLILVGDSMVYGTGVEAKQTAAARLRERLSRPVASFGHVGDSPVSYVFKVANMAPLLRPRVVVVFLYRNDRIDTLAQRSPDDLRRFIESGRAPEAEQTSLERMFQAVPQAGALSTLVDASHLTRLLRFYYLRHVVRRPRFGINRQAARGGPRELASRYAEAAFARMQRDCRAMGATLVLGLMPSRTHAGSPRRHEAVAVERDGRHIARDLGLPLFDPGTAFRLADGTPDDATFLPGDFHLTPEGHRRLAGELARFLEQRGLLEP